MSVGRRTNSRRLTDQERREFRDLDDESVQVREVFAYFGRAMYQAQVLDHGIVNLLTIAGLANGTLDLADFDNYQDKRFRDQLAELVRRTKPHVGEDTGVMTDLSGAVKTRNWLAHGYFRERAPEFATWNGRRQMLGELGEIADRFEDVDRRLHRVLLIFGRDHGFTQSAIDSMYARMQASSSVIDDSSPAGE